MKVVLSELIKLDKVEETKKLETIIFCIQHPEILEKLREVLK